MARTVLRSTPTVYSDAPVTTDKSNQASPHTRCVYVWSDVGKWQKASQKCHRLRQLSNRVSRTRQTFCSVSRLRLLNLHSVKDLKERKPEFQRTLMPWTATIIMPLTATARIRIIFSSRQWQVSPALAAAVQVPSDRLAPLRRVWPPLPPAPICGRSSPQ